MTQAALATAAPREVRRALGRVAARLRTVGALKGLGTLAIVASIGAVLGMAADFAWPLPMNVRWAIWGAWLALTGLVALASIVRPLVRPLADLDLAALAERGQPELGERLVGTVALLAHGARAHGSRALIEALAGQAADRASSLDPRRAVAGGRAARRFAIGLLIAGLVVAPSLLRPDPFGTMARRFFAPWLDLDRVGRFAIRVDPGDKVVALGSDLTVSARVAPRITLGLKATPPDAAWLEWVDAAGKSQRLRMATKASDDPEARAFEARLPRLDGSIRYRVTTVLATSPRYRVEAVEPPTIGSMTAVVEPPSYTKLPTGPARDPSRIDVVEGSAIAFTFATSRPVAGIEVDWPEFGDSEGRTRRLEVKPGPDGKAASVRVTAEAAGSYAFATRPVRDVYGLDGPREPRKLVVRPDAPPSLSARPVEAREAGVDDVLTVPLSAVDDFAVASAELHYEIKRGGSDAQEPETGKVELPLDGLGTRRAAGEAALGLKSLGLRPGDAIGYRIRVADNRPAPPGPNVTWSERGSLAIVAKAEPILARRDRLRRERVRERIEEIKKENLSNRHETTQLRYAADSAQRNPSAWDVERDRALADRAATARKVVDDLSALAGDLEADPDYRPLARPAKEIADVEAEAGRVALASAKAAADNPARRLAELRGADSRLGAVHHRIEELQRQFDELARLDKDRQRLRELAAREDALASDAARAGDDRAALDAVRDEQEAVRRELDALASQSPDLKAGLLDAQAKEAAALAEKARALANRQRDEARATAEAAKPDGALAALAEAQRQIEVDARRLALDVDEPLAENGRGPLDPTPLRDAVSPIERGEVKEGRERLERAESELRRLARDLEDAPGDPKALVRRLARRQEELARRVAEAVREFKGKAKPTSQDRAALAAAIRPLAADQEAILKLAEAIRVDEPRKAAARDASQAVARARDNLRSVQPRESEARQDEAKQALNRLAEALPDHWHRDEPARKSLEEARRLADEATRDIERHLRETAPEPGKPSDPAKLAVELARRLEPLAKKEIEAADRLAAMDAPSRVDPQRRRVERRARALAALMDDLRKVSAPLEKAPGAFVPIRDWQVVGPFPRDQAPPFSPRGPIDAKAKFKGKKGDVGWKAARSIDDRGKVDLGVLYSKEDNQSAFASAELVRPEAGVARFAVGSDDTLAVWVDGKPAFEFGANRSYSPEQVTFEVALKKGANRVVVRCGNISGEWAFGVEVSPPNPFPVELARAEAIRRALPEAALDAKESLDRLGQGLNGQVPADDAAEELAAEAGDLARSAAKLEAQADPASRRALADDAHRLATALRSLPARDASALRAEAVARSEDAARALDNPKPDAAPDLARAARAARSLADRLNDRLTPRAEALALAEAQRGLDVADPIAQARRQQAVAAQAARLESETLRTQPGAAKPPSKDDASASDATSRASDLAERSTHPANDPSRPAPTAAGLASARAEAAKALDRLADAAQKSPVPTAAPPRERPLPDAPRDPELDPLRDRLARAKDLARRERLVRERLQAVLNERAAPQEGLRREAESLGRELADLRERSREPGPRGRGHADAAVELLANQAPRAMDQALDGLAQGRPDVARESQRRSGELIERAAQSAEDLAQALKADRPADAAPADLAPARDALAEAGRRLADEGREPGPGQGPGAGSLPGPSAAKAMRQASQSMRSAARPAPGRGQGPGEEDSGAAASVASGGATADPKSAPAGVAPADLSELQAMVRQKAGRNWGELPGHLRTEILQLSQGKYRDDYARLIQLYFQEIAADAAKPEPK